MAAEQDVNKQPQTRGKGQPWERGVGERGPRSNRPAQVCSCPAPPDRGPDPGPGATLPLKRKHRKPQRLWKPKPTRPSAPRPSLLAPRPAATYLNAQSGSLASRPGAPRPLLLLKSFWNSVGAMMATARPGSLHRALARPPLLELPRHPHRRLSHMTEISHFKRPRRAGRGARQGRRPLAGGEPHHVVARGAGCKAGPWGGAGAHRLAGGCPHVAAHGAGHARRGGAGNWGGWGREKGTCTGPGLSP